MPRPPILEPVDYRAAWNAGLEWEPWLAAAESAEAAERMRAAALAQPLNPSQIALLRGLPRAVHVLAYAEDWCGDVQRHAPVLARMVAEAPALLRVRFVSRDQHPEGFKRYLTNGGEAVPKFVFFNEGFVECGNWGPMPEAGRRLIGRGKACGDVPSARKKVALLDEADLSNSATRRELLELIDIAANGLH